MGRTANIIIKDVIHVFASISKIMRILLMGRRKRERLFTIWNNALTSTRIVEIHPQGGHPHPGFNFFLIFYFLARLSELYIFLYTYTASIQEENFTQIHLLTGNFICPRPMNNGQCQALTSLIPFHKIPANSKILLHKLLNYPRHQRVNHINQVPFCSPYSTDSTCRDLCYLWFLTRNSHKSEKLLQATTILQVIRLLQTFVHVTTTHSCHDVQNFAAFASL